MRTDILERKNEILQWIAEGKSKAYIAKQLKCKSTTLNSYLQKMKINYAGKQNWSKGVTFDTRYIPVEEYLKKDYVKSSILKQKLIREGYKKNQCELCGALIWQGIELPLELHHKDGNHYNNSLENLQILCPNCHSIQEGNSGANIGKYSQNNLEEQNNSRNIAKIKTKTCQICGKLISDKSTLCEECYHKSTRIDKYQEETHIMRNTHNIINREELKTLIRTTPFTKIGKIYGVTDNAVRKWCDKFNLPRKTSDIKKYTDEEWEKL